VTPGGDPYKVLQVDPEAEDEVIAAAYRRLARKYHPDVAGGAEAAARMAGINAAWEIIGDPARRADFDRRRAVEVALSRRRAEAGAAAGGGVGGRADSPVKAGFDRPVRSTPPPPESVSRDWTGGRSAFGGGYDASMHTADGEGAAGAPPGNPSGSVLTFGRYAGWSLGEIGRTDLEYIEWLDRMPIGRPYRDEIDALLRASDRRRSSATESTERRGLFRRR
jgi:curved DNA-binding protein CbpA